MSNIIKTFKLFLFMLFVIVIFIGCTEDIENDKAGEGGIAENGSVYFLSFKPEIKSQFKNVGKAFTDKTGIEIRIVTAETGTYEKTLLSMAGKNDVPTLFQVNGKDNLEFWKEYCADLSDTEIYNLLSDKSLALSCDNKICAIPYTIEGYGIIYNKTILNKYFSLENRKSEINSIDEINNFNKLKSVVEDMNNHIDELGIEGVFASTSMAAGNQWRWQTHLANIPIYYEFDNKNVEDSDAIDFKYNNNFKNIFDLYLNNSVTPSNKISAKTVKDSMEEFALGKCAMVQNGNWAWPEILSFEKRTVDAEEVGIMPIYMGFSGEEKSGLCVGTENYICVNKKASLDDQKASLEFLNWLFNSPEGKKYAVNELGFITPFSSFSDNEMPEDPLAKQVLKYIADNEKVNIPWVFNVFPGDDFKNNFGDSLFEYSIGHKSWNEVVESVKYDWIQMKNQQK